MKMKLWFIIILMMSTLSVISSNSWLSAWMGLEINLIAFLPLMNTNNNLMCLESSLTYFLTQAMASTLLLFSIIFFMYFYFLNLNSLKFMNSMIMMTLMMKMGSAPLHLWLILVMENLNWMNNLILMTWQKLSTMVMISYCINNKLMLFFLIMSATLGAMKGLNQTSMRKMMAFSSINHISWMLSSMMLSFFTWKIYFIIYSLISINLIMLINKFNIFFINQLYSMKLKKLNMKLILFINILSMGGLPPFIGFFPKMMVIQLLSNNKMYFILIILICCSMITLYFYLRLTYSSFMFNLNQLKNKMNFNKFKNILLMFNYINNMGLIMSFFMFF